MTEIEKRSRRICGIVIFLLALFSYSYFFQNPWNWNSVPRTAMAVSIVERGALDINEFARATGDKAYYKGNFYSEKAPGISLMALPSVYLTKHYFDAKAGSYAWTYKGGGISYYFIAAMQFATITAVGLVTAAAALALYLLALRLGAGLTGASFGALAYALATPTWGWATALFGHAPAGALLLLGLAVIVYTAQAPPSKLKDIIAAFTAGAFLSWAVTVEYTSAPASALIALYGVWQLKTTGREGMLRILVSAAAGAVLFILPPLVINHMIFGSPFTSAYKYAVSFEKMSEGYYGITSLPRPEVIYRILIGPGKGLFVLSPVLLFSFYAVYRMFREPERRALGLLVTLVFLYYVLWNASYYYWDGGGSIGPRYLTPAIPFLCLSIALLWDRSMRYVKIAMTALLAVSFFISLTVVSISTVDNPKGPPDAFILTSHLLPGFFGDTKFSTSILVLYFLLPAGRQALSGQTALIPFYVVLAICAAIIIGQLRKVKNELQL